jgi:hypothetical protein
LEIEPEILQTTEEEPNLSIRSLALRVGVINKGRNRNRLIGLRNLSPHLNGAAYFDFLQNVLNDPLNIIEELTASVMQTAENIRENPEMLVLLLGFFGPKDTSLHE